MSDLPNGGAADDARVLAALCDAAAEPLFVVRVAPGPRFLLAFANRAWLEPRGLALAQAQGRTVEELSAPRAGGTIDALYREALATGQPISYGDTVEGPGGTLLLQISLTPLLDDRGKCSLLVGAGLDVTERARSREALRRSDERFGSLVEALPESVLVQCRGRLVYVNSAAVKLLGWNDPSQLVGGEMASNIHPDHRAQVEARVEEALRTREPVPATELRMLARDGTAIDVEMVSLAVQYDGADCTMGIARDLRGRKSMEAQLQLADRMVSVGTLAAGVAHEINNPLGYVIGNLGYLADGLARLRGQPGAAGVEIPALELALHEVWDGAKRVRDIVHDLKTFSRTDVERRGPVDLRRVLDAAMRMAQNELRHTATLTIDLPALPPVEGDASRLSQVFLNLLINAAQAMPERPSSENRIRLAARSDEERVVVEVHDNGAGMSKETQRRIFDPFFTTKPVGVGTGLGLSIVHSIVTAMRGEISVESEIGSGTTFRVVLPQALQPLAAAEGPADEPAPSGARARVLVIDDEPLVGTSIRRVLSGEHDVEAVTQAAEALRRISAGERFDALLCDLMMPEMTGMDLHAELTRAVPEQAVRMGFLTGGTFTKRASAFLERMRDRTLPKPFSTEALRAFVRKLSGA
jgi:PAS domain S-box-containing protein